MPLAHLTKSIFIVTMICAIFAGDLAADTKNTFIVQPGQSSTKKIPSKLLDGVIALRVVQNDERVKGFKVRIGRRTSRETSVTISATRDTPIAVGFQLAGLVAGSKTITLPYDVHVAGTRSLVDSYVNFHNDATDADSNSTRYNDKVQGDRSHSSSRTDRKDTEAHAARPTGGCCTS